MRRLLFPGSLILAAMLAANPASAHVGSPNVIFEGMAGDIPVRVIVRPPGVVPGLAAIDVRVLTNGVQKISVLPVHWRAGLDGSPPPDVCEPVEGEPGLYHADLWLMATGAYSVHVKVETRRGSGTVIVPVNSLATTRLPMPPALTLILAALGLLLFLLAISVAGAAVRESVLDPAQPVPARRRWFGRAATAVAAVVIAASVFGGKAWWDSVDRDYRNNRMFKPVPVTTRARAEGGRPILRLTVDERKAGNAWGPLVPDHGKLMHLFLMREPALDAFAHLHPVRRSGTVFESALPDLPPGRYRVCADVTHESGFAQTLVSSVTIEGTAPGTATSTAPGEPGAPGEMALQPDPDDSFLAGPPAPSASDSGDGRRQPLGDGLTLVWDEPPRLDFGRALTLRFRVVDSGDRPVKLEAYMGMLSHLILARDDGSVFTHLHPAGSISVASQQVFQLRAGEKPPKRITPAMMEKLCQPPGPELLQQPISFPYEFPKPGNYRLWIQVRAGGRIRTAALSADVAAAR